MKGMLRAGGVAVILYGLLFAGRSHSKPMKAPAPPSKVGVINVSHVLKNYKKVDDFAQEMKVWYNRFDTALQAKRSELQGRKIQLDDPALAPHYEALRKEVRKLQCEIEDMHREMKSATEEKTDKQIVAVYAAIRKAAERYAKANGLEVVLYSKDGVNEAEPDMALSIRTKMQSRSYLPLYVAGGIDFSADIVAALNKDYEKEKSSPPDKK